MYITHYIYRAKGVAEEGRKLRPNQTTPAMQKHTHMMKRTLGYPALRTGTVGYQLSPHTQTQQHQSLDYSNSTPYMYIHSTCTYTCNKIWSFCRADLQGCFYSTLEGHRPHTCTDHIHVCTCTLCNMFTITWQTTTSLWSYMFCTLYKYMDVKDSQQNL